MDSSVSYREHPSYWNDFYQRGHAAAPRLPSQFAAFALGEMLTPDSPMGQIDGVIEFGCGNGRDSQLFAAHGLSVLGLDESIEAIGLCRVAGLPAHARFECCAARQAWEAVEVFAEQHSRVAVYARFFLHAISEEDEHSLLALLQATLPEGAPLFLEYRTTADADQHKIFGESHYRRYLDHRATLARIAAAGFATVYEIEGRGFAKYREEDALVGRCIAIRNASLA